MDAKKKQVEGESYREEYRDTYRQAHGEDRYRPPELEVPDEMEAWALDDMSDLLPSTFD